MCPLCKIYSQSKTSTLYSQLQERRQTQKSLVGRWVGAEGNSRYLCSSVFGGAASGVGVVLLGRGEQLTAKLLCHDKAIWSLNYNTFITQIHVREARAKDPKPRINPVWLFPEGGTISEEHFNFEQHWSQP